MRILVATSNPHKLEEIQAVFALVGGSPLPASPASGRGEIASGGGDSGGSGGVVLLSLADLGKSIVEPVEDGDTFEANAIKKGLHYAQASGLPCLADDSGLEVDALGGAPGVLSARYAGVTGPRSVVDPQNNKLLLANLGDRPAGQRTARFVCAMAWCLPDRSEPMAVVRGTVEGRILLPEETADASQPWRGRGSNGFGYDPLFLIAALNQTTAELAPEQKNAISHRGQATRLMWRHLAAWQEKTSRSGPART